MAGEYQLPHSAQEIEEKLYKIDELSTEVTNHKKDNVGHVTASERQSWNNKSDFSGSYNDLTNKPTIPSKTSQLTNDSDYVKRSELGSSDEVPSYWKPAIEEAVAKVKAIQYAGGKDVFNFIHMSDLHRKYGGTNYTDNLGVISENLMCELFIPLAAITGDTAESSAASSSEQVEADVLDVIEMFNRILEKILMNKGNHDGAWGAKATYGVNYAMIQHPKKLWNSLFRWQAEDFRRVFSEDGSYYYVDNIPQKVRYIVLNSHWADYSNITDADYDSQATEYNTQKNINYGDAQAEWLAKEALDFNGEDGWTVCVFTHAPLWNKFNGVSKVYMNVQYAGTNNASTIRSILMAFYNKESATYKTGSTVDYSNVGENCTIAGVWCGHCHTDIICKHDEAGNGTDIPFPIISITSAGNVNSSYEEDFGMPVTTRTLGTATETALDIVSINKVTKQIYCTRVGAGNDRVTSYGEEEPTVVELLSISAKYTGGNVTVGTSLNDLTGITVTAHYSNGTTQTVTDYTMSGSVSNVGNNTITISYSGKTTTITVVGIEAEPSIPDVVLNTNVFDKTADGFQDNYRISSSASGTGYVAAASSNNQFMTNYIRIDKGMYLNVSVPGSTTQSSTTVGGYFLAYDENKNRIGTYNSFSGSVSGNKFKFQVNVAGVVYIRFSPYKTSGSGITVDNCNIVVTTS